MSSVTTGKTFTTTEFTNNNDYNDAISLATADSIVRTDMDSSTSIVHIAATAPASPVIGEHWFDTSGDTLRVYDGANFVNIAHGILLTNNSGETALDGSIVVVDTAQAESFNFTTTQGDTKVCGVLAGDTTDGSLGVVILSGKYKVLVASAVTVRGSIRTSATKFKAEDAVGAADGTIFGLSLEIGSSKVNCRIYI